MSFLFLLVFSVINGQVTVLRPAGSADGVGWYQPKEVLYLDNVTASYSR